MASSQESRFLDDLKRKRVKITLFDTQITGVIQRITQKKTVILEDVSEVKTGRKFPGVKIIFGHEILKVDVTISANQDHLDHEEHKSEIHSFRKRALDDVHEDCVNYVVIDELHENFGPAVMHIQAQKVIGIGADVFGQTSQERLCWLQVATKKVVYLFDILLLGGQAFKNGLSMILENPHVLKVVHDCRCVARCLRAEFRVNLNNVFDTQVADLMLFYNETGGFLPDRLSSLQEVLRLHLKLPTTDLLPLCSKEIQCKECPEVWYVRPSPPALMNVMAASVSHLLPLRLVLLDALMSDYTLLVDAYMSSCHNQSVHVEQDERTLPEEAEELLSVRQERMELAARRYSLTDGGLLKRSSFSTQTDSALDSICPAVQSSIFFRLSERHAVNARFVLFYTILRPDGCCRDALTLNIRVYGAGAPLRVCGQTLLSSEAPPPEEEKEASRRDGIAFPVVPVLFAGIVLFLALVAVGRVTVFEWGKQKDKILERSSPLSMVMCTSPPPNPLLLTSLRGEEHNSGSGRPKASRSGASACGDRGTPSSLEKLSRVETARPKGVRRTRGGSGRRFHREILRLLAIFPRGFP
ncbi:hypothetical protein Q8A67_019041 [Cirrhinus molitorella]|uniref:3'-5' exonuclease domain-containing protein n=1 Tax=Cirrhinus molitorella TaxID=172907 RepID=A0AA88P6F5_9TELE|nr:hypothetical protein Q8A67_019041 [Cirrhinus molitorella]